MDGIGRKKLSGGVIDMAKFVKIGKNLINIDYVAYIQKNDWDAKTPYCVWMVGDTELVFLTKEEGELLIEKVTK